MKSSNILTSIEKINKCANKEISENKTYHIDSKTKRKMNEDENIKLFIKTTKE